MRKTGVEVIVVDGGSSDNTCNKAEPYVDQLIISDQAGRASQMNIGAKMSAGEILWFLHADTMVPERATDTIAESLNHNMWGRFNVRLSGGSILLRIIEKMINIRSCWSGIATGDQGIFLTRTIFEKVGGYPLIPLMEDIALSKRLKREGRPACVKQQLITSSRRWEERGIVTTVVLMWRLRFAYWVGVSPHRIAKMYQ